MVAATSAWQLAPATQLRSLSRPVAAVRATNVVAMGLVEPRQMLGPIAVATKAKEALAAFCALPRTIKLAAGVLAVLSAALIYVFEQSRKDRLIEAGDKCMTAGDEDACEIYDAGVERTPYWKLKWASNLLPQSNVLADKLGAPPTGFSWGKTF